jgi:hypothetical protein
MIVIDNNKIVIAEAIKIEIVDEQGEKSLIKVLTNLDDEYGYYYIGTPDRYTYEIIDKNTPDINKNWRYINNKFIEI